MYFFILYHRKYEQIFCLTGCPKYYKDIELIGFSDTKAGAKFIMWEEMKRRGMGV